MNKSELIKAAARASGTTLKISEAVCEAFLEELAGALEAGDNVTLSGFGTFRRGMRISGLNSKKVACVNFSMGEGLKRRMNSKGKSTEKQ